MLPTVAEVLALDPVRSGAPRVLAGAERLSAPVRWVHVIELAQAAHLLRGGELVLSTGIALPDDPAGLSRYVAELASVGVSAPSGRARLALLAQPAVRPCGCCRRPPAAAHRA